MNSLRGRLLITAFLVLLAYMAVTGATLQRAFIRQSEQALENRMQGLVYALLGAAEYENKLLAVSEPLLPDEKLRKPDSGLYAEILDENAKPVWRSPSVLSDFALHVTPEVGEWWFGYVPASGQYQLAFGLIWPNENDELTRFTVAVAEDGTTLRSQSQRFGNTLWIGLGIGVGLLLLVLYTVLRWGLRPVGQLADELRRIEEGGEGQIHGRYPDELQPLTEALNAALRSERGRQARYRNALDDLAHSLKTPLTVLAGEVGRQNLTAQQRAALDEQLQRMRRIVDYQLNRAATAGSSGMAAPIELLPAARQLCNAIAKVYADKAPRIDIDIASGLTVRMDPGDLTEILGNLIDNAGKWCKSRLAVSAEMTAGDVLIRIADDGPGFPDDAGDLLQRGIRADNRIEGQGIGLSIVNDIADSYEGSVELGRSDFGGGLVTLRLPNR